MFPIIAGGLFLGAIIYMFTFIVCKQTGQYYLAPLMTFLFSILITAFGMFVIGGFEGMAYGFLATGFLLVSIIGALFLPLFVRKKEPQKLKRTDKVSLFILPILFFTMIGLTLYSDQGYWVIDQGTMTYDETSSRNGDYYRMSTISEGKKQLSLRLGEDYLGKAIEVDHVSRWGSTEITVRIVEGDDETKTPYLSIGLNEIKEPLQVKTTDGVEFESILDLDRNE
ncbi:hypothetical protein [Salisediminibacterium beveridgei]|uniref:YesK-like protein n=1 Tax=Salisediminibacterium beveridgei TaxID=632773 RepID=A0A1D7QZA8_9BACI|nr:hypothetical protein [Salisediminibacterium beveridgei]AOM84351.1 hypothetical protein BBEV_3033 [Salisediminibacterium beveridgei]